MVSSEEVKNSVFLEEDIKVLDNVVVYANTDSPYKIVQKAFNNIAKNYS